MISVIVPLFNQGKYINDCIDSVIDNFYNGIGDQTEIIIVNDGSTDFSYDAIRKYDGWRNIKIINQVNKGLASARNTGIMNAKYDWILPLDADDMLRENCLKKILEVIKENPDIDIFAPSFKEFGISNAEVILMPNPTLEDFKTGNRIGYLAAIRKNALLAVGGYSPRMTFGYEDYHLWFNLLTRGYKLKTIPEVLWLYRTKEKSMIHEAQAHHKELIDQINKDMPEAKLNF